MLNAIIRFSLRQPLVIIALAAIVLAGGAWEMTRLPVDVFPEFEAPTVKVQTEALGLSAEEVENLVTLNLEELLSGVPWLESIRSQSVTGLSSIVLIFKRGTDFIRARQMVQERLALAIYLPNVAQSPAILQPLSAISRFMMIGISSDEVEPTDLSMIARWSIKPKLTGIPGVANVSIWGQRLRQMQVQIDPRRLRDARLMQDDIITAAGDSLWVSPLTFLKASTPGTGGWIDNPNQRFGVMHKMPINTPEDMAKVAVAPQHLLLKGKKMALGDVADVVVVALEAVVAGAVGSVADGARLLGDLGEIAGGSAAVEAGHTLGIEVAGQERGVACVDPLLVAQLVLVGRGLGEHPGLVEGVAGEAAFLRDEAHVGAV